MALVKMKVQISGSRNGEDWPGPGEVLDVSDDEAATLVHTGIAELADVPVESAALDTSPKSRRA